MRNAVHDGQLSSCLVAFCVYVDSKTSVSRHALTLSLPQKCDGVCLFLLQVREVAERSKQRGNMLAQLFAAVRKVADAKQQLQDAEGQLQEALLAAETYLQVCMQSTCYALCELCCIGRAPCCPF